MSKPFSVERVEEVRRMKADFIANRQKLYGESAEVAEAVYNKAICAAAGRIFPKVANLLKRVK